MGGPPRRKTGLAVTAASPVFPRRCEVPKARLELARGLPPLGPEGRFGVLLPRCPALLSCCKLSHVSDFRRFRVVRPLPESCPMLAIVDHIWTIPRPRFYRRAAPQAATTESRPQEITSRGPRSPVALFELRAGLWMPPSRSGPQTDPKKPTEDATRWR